MIDIYIILSAGIIGLLSSLIGGFFMFRGLKQSRDWLIREVKQAEDELLQDISSESFSQLQTTEAGKELLKFAQEFWAQWNDETGEIESVNEPKTFDKFIIYIHKYLEDFENNERLEFLGDSIIDFIISDWLYQHFPEKSEGQLTRMRSALVRTENLSEFARKLISKPDLFSVGSNFDAKALSSPSKLCSAFETMVGAIFIDEGIDAAREILMPLLDGSEQENLESTQDPKSRLQELVREGNQGFPTYRIVRQLDKSVSQRFEVEVLINGKVYGRGVGSSKQNAANKAAQEALNEIQNELSVSFKDRSTIS